ncbi:hypothetical protein O1611_g8430 [Lasiodiplodia mahajangana]|uniref:Uncharacterized protein n=1 Tax=Lasiodiplodia mahajangana TaxID=1108764 RepID=A0ACC2JCI0_9PEZI|nr:hypothetical protein O1611_g8430 [Lasiodiplodia mahajangana]
MSVLFARIVKTPLRTCRPTHLQPAHAYTYFGRLNPFSTEQRPSVTYEYTEDVESPYSYCKGGYHPITIGDCLHGRYRVVHKLGFGGYSTTWLARDVQQSKYVAVKVGMADSDEKEVEILAHLTSSAAGQEHGGRSMIQPVLDRFTIAGPNGTHPCFVTAPARCSLALSLEAGLGLFQLDVAQSLAAQLVMAVAYTHDKGYFHGDLHLGKILLRSTSNFDRLSEKQIDEKLGSPYRQPVRREDGEPLAPGVPSHVFVPVWLGEKSHIVSLAEAKLVLADFGVAFGPAKEARFQSYTPPQMQPPEARFDPDSPLSFASDIWSLGCAIWAILARGPFMDSFFLSEDVATREQADSLGPLPPEWWEKWERRHEYFIANGQPREDRETWSWDRRFEYSIQQARREKDMDVLDAKEKEVFSEMVRSMLSFKPGDRPSARQVLNTSWMKDWAIPDKAKALPTERSKRSDKFKRAPSPPLQNSGRQDESSAAVSPIRTPKQPYRPTKRSAGINGTAASSQQHGTTDSEHESVASEPPEKRTMTHRDHHGSHHGRNGSVDHENFDISGGSLSKRLGLDPLIYPDESLIQRTFNHYFRHVHHVPVFSFLHRASLMQRYHAGMMDRALLLALVGVTSLLTDLGPGMREYGARCIDECQNMVLQDLENPSTIKIQALVLVMKHRILSRRFTSAFMLAATAARFAYALRLNYENPSLCFLARESRRRLMWAFLTIDSGVNGGQADFTLLPPDSLHIQLPCNERNFEFDLPQVTGHLRPLPSQPFPDDVGSLALHVRLLWMRSRVSYCTKNVLNMPESEVAQLPQLIKVLSRELDTFNDHLPASFKFSESNLQLRAYSPRLCVYIMIHVWWRQCHCDLYRIVLSGLKEALPRSGVSRLEPQFVSYCTRQCFEHAIAMVEIFRLILALDGGLPVTDLDLSVCAYQCARMLYFAYQTNKSELRLTMDQVVEHGNRCLQIARAMNHVPAGAAIVSDLEKLISRGLTSSASPSRQETPEVMGAGTVSQPPLSRQVINQNQHIHLLDEGEAPMVPVPSPTVNMPSPGLNTNNGAIHTPVSSNTPIPPQHRRDPSFSDLAVSDPTMVRPNLPPVVPPDGLDNNNAFEGAMDGFDFALESYGNTGVESASWFSQEWLSTDFPPMTV